MTVFEISNQALKEFYLCASERPMDELMRLHCDRPPAAIAHWGKDQGVYYAEVERFATKDLAGVFMENYREVLARTGWKVLV